MGDNTSNCGDPDRSQINLNEDYEVRHWTARLGMTKEELARAVDQVGSNMGKVREYRGASK
jgi:hypothetical protein